MVNFVILVMVGGGLMGGMSTFSSFVYGSVVLMHASIASAVLALVYIVVSLVLATSRSSSERSSAARLVDR